MSSVLVGGCWLEGPDDAPWPMMDRAIEAAAQAFPVWSRAPRCERKALLERIAARVLVEADFLSDTMAREVRKR